MKKIIFYAFVFLPTYVCSQVYSPNYKTSFTVINDSNQFLNNYQVLLVYNTLLPIGAGHMNADGSDMRFSADSCNPSVYFNYWIEEGLNTDSTRIWIQIPGLAASSSTNFLLWYGDSSASSMSSFALTFPNAFISNGNDTTLSGLINVDWFQLDTGDIINIQPNSPLEIRARVIKINGNISGNGMGHSAPLTLGNGGGPGGGGQSNNAGAGGGSYAGLGGTGGDDVGDTPGTGGPIYGAVNDLSNWMGSSGGTTDNAMGGSGGGALLLKAEWVTIEGQISVNGDNGIGSIGRCGGGGSGGTILIIGENIDLSTASILLADGGDGGDGSSPANDGGGGGSGGRIKIFYESSFNTSGGVSFLAGLGGVYGSNAYGTDGAPGTYFDAALAITSTYAFDIGSENALTAVILGLDSVYCLSKDSILITAEPPGGVFSGPGVVLNYFYPLLAGVGIHSITYEYIDPVCGNLYDTVTVEVLNIPLLPSATSNGPLCEGQTLMLQASHPTATHFWTGPNGFSSPGQFPVLANISTADSGIYMVTLTNLEGCSSSATTQLTVYPTPDMDVTNNGPICINADIIFTASGGTSWSWTGPNGFSSILQSPTILDATPVNEGIYTVTATGPGGCTAATTTELVMDDCYDYVENPKFADFSIYPNPAYEEVWIEFNDEQLLNGLSLRMFDTNGQEISLEVIGSDLTRFKINIQKLAPGVYYILTRNYLFEKGFKLIKQ